MTDRELMQQALEALEMWCKGPHDSATRRGANTRSSVAITALRERLAQPEQEPVAGEYATCLEDGERVLIASILPVGYGGNKTRTVRVVWSDGTDGVYTLFQFAKLFAPLNTPTTPPRREWVGLTEAEKVNVAIDCGCADVAWMDFADTIEAKLKEKNT